MNIDTYMKGFNDGLEWAKENVILPDNEKAIEEAKQETAKEIFKRLNNSTIRVPLFHTDCYCEWCNIMNDFEIKPITENKEAGR